MEYEIIKIDNPGTMGISEAYNRGIAATFDYLCFCHEDILFQTEGWGRKLLEIFSYDSQIGLIGIAGSPYLPYVYSGWSFPHSGLEKMYLIQPGNDKKGHLIDIRSS